MIDLDENRRELLNLKDRFLELEKTVGKEEKLKKSLKELEEKTLDSRFLERYEKGKCCTQRYERC